MVDQKLIERINDCKKLEDLKKLQQDAVNSVKNNVRIGLTAEQQAYFNKKHELERKARVS